MIFLWIQTRLVAAGPDKYRRVTCRVIRRDSPRGTEASCRSTNPRVIPGTSGLQNDVDRVAVRSGVAAPGGQRGRCWSPPIHRFSLVGTGRINNTAYYA